MADKIQLSILLITYNQTIEDIEFTLRSIIRQDLSGFEVVIADDHSTDFPKESIERLFEEANFKNYKIIVNSENMGIVKNMISGMEAASGDAIKMISPGDAFFGPNTLASIQNFFLKESFPIGFGRVVAFGKKSERMINIAAFDAPTNPRLYGAEEDYGVALASQIIATDWIPGCSLFYKKDFILPYLKALSNTYNVIHSEDLSVPLITIDNQPIGFLDENILWYELGTGISSTGSKATRERMYRDHHNFFFNLEKNYPDNPIIRKATKRFKLREFIALKTPFYTIAKRAKERGYLNDKSENESGTSFNASFVEHCMKNDFDR